MALVGYPDWERVQREGGDLVAIVQQPINAVTTFGPYNVQQWKAIRLQASCAGSTDFYQIELQWYDSVTLTNRLSTQDLFITQQLVLPISIPTQGPYLQIVISPSTGGSSSIVTVSFAGIRATPSVWLMEAFSQPLIIDSSAYTANLTKLLGGNLYYGNAIFHVSPDAGPISLIQVKFLSPLTVTFGVAMQWRNIAAGVPLHVPVSLPAVPIEVFVTNGATAQNITTSLMPAAP